ncbi:hypothetical protein HanRHA438_Chr08g0341441 [Helianthus annuus]|nr:hypothetical protein HanRHA438_Chr08g0341441 [Helianthus annuus]
MRVVFFKREPGLKQNMLRGVLLPLIDNNCISWSNHESFAYKLDLFFRMDYKKHINTFCMWSLC